MFLMAEQTVWLERLPLPLRAKAGDVPQETWHLSDVSSQQTLCGMNTGSLNSVETPWETVPTKCGMCHWLGSRSEPGT